MKLHADQTIYNSSNYMLKYFICIKMSQMKRMSELAWSSKKTNLNQAEIHKFLTNARRELHKSILLKLPRQSVL